MLKKQVPKYQHVKNYVLSRIESNDMKPHERVPSESELTELLEVSSITVKKALSDLVNEGIIYRVRGKGSFIAKREVVTEIAQPLNLVVVVISGRVFNDISYIQIVKGAQSYLANHATKLIIEFVDENVEKERDLILNLLDMDIYGFLIYSSDPNAAKSYLKDIKSKGKPFVMIDRFPNGMSVNSVTCNNHDGAFSAVDYLIQLGHRRVGFVGYDFYLSSEVERYNGFCSALANAEIEKNDKIIFVRKELDYDEMAAQVKSGGITALFCVNDRRAIEVIDELVAREVRIPEDLSIIGFDDWEGGGYAKVPLTTVKQHFDTLGYEAAKLLLEAGKDPSIGTKKILLPTNTIHRESTASYPRV